jgi:hypothetical protein
MSKPSTVIARITINWSNSFVVDASLETLAALRSARAVDRGYLANTNVDYLTDCPIAIEIIEASPTMTESEYRELRDAEKADA